VIEGFDQLTHSDYVEALVPQSSSRSSCPSVVEIKLGKLSPELTTPETCSDSWNSCGATIGASG
jgi:hypothetical protein